MSLVKAYESIEELKKKVVSMSDGVLAPLARKRIGDEVVAGLEEIRQTIHDEIIGDGDLDEEDEESTEETDEEN